MIKLQRFAKYLAKSFAMQNNFKTFVHIETVFKC